MATRYIARESGAAQSHTGSHAGIGADSDTDLVYVNASGTRQQVITSASGAEGSADLQMTAPSGYAYRWNGMAKFINRPTTDDFTMQVKAEPTPTAANYGGIMSHVDVKAAMASGQAAGLMGITTLKSTYTATGGNLVGTYGQAANAGTLNGSGILLAGLCGLIEDGGVYTAVGHVCAQWLDSHLSQTVTAGKTSFSLITNNGTTTFDNVFYVHGSDKITNLLSLNFVAGMVAEGGAGTIGGTIKKINITIDGVAYYLVAGTTVS